MIKIEDSSVIFFDITNDEIELLAKSIEKFFSFEIFVPKILLNKNFLPYFSQCLKSSCEIAFLDCLKEKFAKITHSGEFDLGIFFEKNKMFFISGNASDLSATKMSIIKKFFSK